MENNAPMSEPLPEVGSAYSYGWNVIKKNFVPLLAVVVVMLIAQGLVSFKGGNYEGAYTFSDGALLFLLGILVAGPVSYSGKLVFLKAVRGEQFDVKDVFSCFGPRYLDIMMAYLFTNLIIVAGVIFFIVPGIVFAVRLAFVPYLVTDQEMPFTEAFKKSREMTKGYSWQLFFMGVIAFFIAIIGVLLFFVGIFPAVMLIQAAFATFYYAVSRNTPFVIEV